MQNLLCQKTKRHFMEFMWIYLYKISDKALQYFIDP